GDPVAPQDVAHRVEVVVIDDVNIPLLDIGNASRNRVKRILARGNARTDRVKAADDVGGNIVVPAVVTALDDDDVVMASVSPCNPYCVVGCLGAGIGKLDTLNRRNMSANKLGEFALPLRRTGA